jgi:hypothetical protein
VDQLLARLREFVELYPNRCAFNAPATSAAIVAAESAMGLPIPEDYKAFLRCFNGGFITLAETRDDPDWDEGSAGWHSHSLFSAHRLVNEYTDQRLIWERDLGWPERWPYMPFCYTRG